ncbi:inositol oxygenase 2-like [Camellia sinensis]|uniref:inositol oxygenase 2-like n=1 Tax=Camellia sinensis TaxID=4442 RepID=UPI001035E94D|nr:inositol oxygenase 2-like [Camellia sinensis]
MTILIEQPDLGLQGEDKRVPFDNNDLVLDGGFPVPKSMQDAGFDAPEINSFGHSFRDYNAESERQQTVEEFYRVNHINQTYDFVGFNIVLVICYPSKHLGKVLLHPSFGGLPQWAVVGDTFPLGCAFDKSIVHHKYFEHNPDSKNPVYNTENGIYVEGCGLDNVMISWGHDDYMYLVAKENGSTLPPAALFIIRYHSFYPLHKSGAYTHLMNEDDVENLKWLKIFNKYDLYSKSKVRIDVEKVKPYYLSLIEKYFPVKLRW